MHIFLILFTFLCLPITTLATTLNAEARAGSKEQAQRQALSDLANSIFVNVKSESSSDVEGSGKRKDEIHIKSSSDIPLMGANISCSSMGSEVNCKVSLESTKSLALYSRKLNELSLEIRTLGARIAKLSGEELFSLLTQILTEIEQYEKHRAVAQMLGGTQFAVLAYSRLDIETQLHALEKSVPTIDLAVQVLTKGLKVEAVYIYPPVPHGSSEVTVFGSVVRSHLAAKLSSVESPKKAQTFFKGEYEILDNGIHLSYRLTDIDGNTLGTRVTMLAPAAYKGLRVKPTTVAFEKLLHEGVAVSSDFKVSLTTNRGSENIMFNEGEEAELFVKLNRHGYFYIVGHVAKKGESYSYLLEQSNDETERRFIRYVNADEVNKWISIGKFEVTPPYGVESMQIIATSDDPISRLPAHNQAKDMYVVSKNSQQGITKTRALKPKRTETDKQYQGETVLMFTTMAKSDSRGW